MPTTTHLAPLPGQTSADPGLIDETVAELNAAVDRGGLATMRELARIVLDKMFRDDAASFLAADGTHASYLALVQHPDLRISKTGLWYAVAVDSFLRTHGEAAAGLTLTHLKRLVHVPDPARQQELVARALADSWTVATLESAIAQGEPDRPADAPRLGRPPLPPQVKRFAKVERAVRTLSDAAPDESDLDDETAQELLSRAEAAQQALNGWIDVLRARLES